MGATERQITADSPVVKCLLTVLYTKYTLSIEC